MKRIKRIEILIQIVLMLLWTQEGVAQQYEKCGTMYADSVLRANTPGIPSLEDFERWIQREIALYLQQNQNARGGRQVYTIPVIVHVVHNGEPVGTGRNISQAQVYSQIDVLNEDFRRLNADAVNTLSQFQPVAADIEIEFCPARVDPNGNVLAEPGIHRYNGGQATWSNTSAIDNTLKPATIWDPNRYFNIWTVDFGGNGLLGYAQFPQGSGLPGMPTGTQSANTDGVVVYYRAFGRVGNVQSPYNRGRTTTHEVGHWLGLRHIWGDGGCSQDDFCADTPPADAASTGCNLNRQSCGGLNMVQNYMDYSNDACMNLFTRDQKNRMRTALTVAVRRASLLNSTVCQVVNPVTVTGKVRDATSLQGIPNAKVRLTQANGNNYTATCDAQGNFTFSNIASGTYTFYAGQWGYITRQLLNVSVQPSMPAITVDLDKGYYDDFVLDFNWVKSSTAATGAWVREKPIGTTYNNQPCAPGADVPGDLGEEAFITGNGGGSAGTDDVDDGYVTLNSPIFDLTTYNDPRIHCSLWFFNDGGNSTPNDTLIVRLSNGFQTVTLENIRSNIQWASRTYRVRDYVTLTANMRIQFTTMDLAGSGHLVEAGVDWFRITDTTAVVLPPVAHFTANVQSGCAPLTVSFSDASANGPTSWNWEFPGGSPASSSQQHPVVIYTIPGTYPVTLTVANQAGSNTKTIQSFITVNPPQLNFSADVTGGCPGLRVSFNDESICPSGNRLWLFPGGIPSSSILATPQVVYPAVGQYDVILIVGNDTLLKSGYVNITTGGVITIFSENFESNSFATNGWTVENPDNQITWQIYPTAGNTSGNYSAGINLYNYTAIGQRDRLVSRTLDLSYVINTTLTFKHAHRRYAPQGQSPSRRDSLIVYVSSDNGITWTRILSAAENGQGSFATNTTIQNAFVPQVPADWCYSGSVGAACFSINLSAYDGNPHVRIRFESVNDYGNYIYLDDIVVSGNCVVGSLRPIAQFEADVTSGCGSLAVQFSDQSVNAPATWQWSFPGGIPASAVVANPVVTYPIPGIYPVSLKVSNAYGTDSVTIAGYIRVFPVPSLNLSVSDVTCYGRDNGTVSAQVSGGTAPYTYAWDNGMTTAMLQSVLPATYSVTVVDANGCSMQGQASVAEPDSLSVAYVKQDADCMQSNGEITLYVSGGTPPYSYAWSNNATSNPLTSIPAGIYEVIVTDANNCAYVAEIEIENPDAPMVTIFSADVSCYGASDGAAVAHVMGGTPPFSFNWSNGATSDSLFGLSTGPYLLTVTDANGCFTFSGISITQPDSITFDLLVTDVLCRQKTGSAEVIQVAGGHPPYRFYWSNGFSGNPNTLLEPGTYVVTVSDSAGCLVVASATVSRIDTFRISVIATPATGTMADGEASVLMLNGTPPFSILWSDGQTTPTATGLAAGVYTVQVVDANGCEAIDTVIIQMISSADPSDVDNLFNIYPNPSSGILYIHWSEYYPYRHRPLYLIDLLGRMVWYIAMSYTNENPLILDISHLEEGVYFVEIPTQAGRAIKRFVLMK